MVEKDKKQKNNMFLNNTKLPPQTETKTYEDRNKDNLRNNRFSNEIGKSRMRENEKKIDTNDSELFPSLLNDYDLFLLSKAVKKQDQSSAVSYKDITNNKETSIKIETDEVEAGWVHLYRDEHNKIIKMYGKTTPECLEIEGKDNEMKKKKKENEIKSLFNQIEYERNVRKELYGDIINFYDPLKDRFYTKEKDIVIYTVSELSDSDTEGSNCDINDTNDYLNDDVYL